MRKSMKISAVLCAFAIVLWFAAGILVHVNNASAAEQTGSLTLWCAKDDDIVKGMHWQIYRVGHRNQNDYVFEGAFADYRPTLGDQSKPMLEWDTDTVAFAGETLKFYTIVDELPPISDGVTDDAGKVTFGDLTDGLYLVWGDYLKVGSTSYYPSAIFFEMNGKDAAVLNAYPKIVLNTLNGDNLNYSVRKVWQNDEEQPWNRTVSITVDRYRDNKRYDSVILDDSNNWTYTWEDRDDHTWFVIERDIPKYYTVLYKQNHTQYLIVNTFETPKDDSSMTDAASTTTTPDDQVIDKQTTTSQTGVTTGDTQTTAINESNQSDSQTTVTTARHGSDRHTYPNGNGTTQRRDTVTTPVRPGGGAFPPNSANPNTPHGYNGGGGDVPTVVTEAVPPRHTVVEKLPQTGQLWWPVPILAVSGVVMLGFGLHLMKKDDSE